MEPTAQDPWDSVVESRCDSGAGSESLRTRGESERARRAHVPGSMRGGCNKEEVVSLFLYNQ